MQMKTNFLNLSNKKFLVTGASSGIGRATEIKISELGGRVIFNGRDECRLKETLSMMDGGGHFAMPFDLLRFDDVKKYIQECINIDGNRFDGFVFSTGIARSQIIRTERIAEFKHVMDINCVTYVALLKEFASKRVLNNQGSIVAVSSSNTKQLSKSGMSYTASKAALEAVSAIAAKELVGRGIRINTVLPEATVTPMTIKFQNNTTEEQKKQWYPLGTLTAEDVANTIIFLLSDTSRKLTGQNIYLSAGNDGRPIDCIIQM